MTARENSIYQTALPYYHGRIDLAKLDVSADDFAKKWMHQMLRRKLAIQINANPAIAGVLNDLYFTARNTERTKGPWTLGLGYPFVLTTQTDGNLLAAPMFIFRIDFTAGSNRVNTWIARHQEHHRIEPNYQLIEFLREQLGLDLTPAFEKVARQFSREALEELCANLAEAADFQNRGVYFTIEPFPSLDEVGDHTATGTVQPSGILGIFPPSENERETERPRGAVAPLTGGAAPADPDAHPFTPIELDPLQATAYDRARNESLSILAGNEGTGKTHTLLALLLNALGNGQRTLVVSEQVPSLRRLQDRLSEAGILRYHFLFKNMVADKPQLLELLRASARAEGSRSTYDEEQWQEDVVHARALNKKLYTAYRTTHNSIFGPHNWTETVGIFLKHNREGSRDLLEGKLPVSAYRFDFEEHEQLTSDLQRARNLYEPVGTLRHPLTELAPALFDRERDHARETLEQQLPGFLAEINRLQQRAIRAVDGYAEKLSAHYHRFAETLDRQIDELRDRYQRAELEYGSDFHTTSDLQLRWLGPISKTRRNILAARREFAEEFRLLQRTLVNRPYFEHRFKTSAASTDVQAQLRELDRFAEDFDAWRKQIDEQVAEEVARLEPASVLPEVDYDRRIVRFEQEVKDLLQQIGESELYLRPIPAPEPTTTAQIALLDRTEEQLEATLLNLRDFDDFHPWQRFYLNADETTVRLIDALVAVQADSWESSFGSWYLHHVLAKHYSNFLPTDDRTLADFQRAERRVAAQFGPHLEAVQQQQRQAALRSFRRADRENYSLIFEKSTRIVTTEKEFRELTAAGLDAITATLPVIFATTDIAGAMLPDDQPGYFDHVLVLNADTIDSGDLGRLSALGKRVVLVTDAPPSELAETLAGSEIPLTQLRTAHRTPLSGLELHERLRRHESQDIKREIRVEAVGGRFSESEETNDLEAQQVIRLINLIEPTALRTYPKVGIVCTTTGQRNIISAYLLKILQKQDPGAEKIEQLQRNGMGIYTLEEIEGQSFDTLIVSFTYGPTDHYGRMTRRIEALNQPRAERRLEQLLHRSALRMYLLHSVPETYLEDFLITPEERGTHLLAALLEYYRYSSEGDEESAAEVLEHFAGTVPAPSRYPASSFVSEIRQALRPYLPQQRMELNAALEEHPIPLLIHPKFPDEPTLALLPEGFVATAPRTDLRWELDRRVAFEAAGMKLLPVFSVDWWKTPHQSARKLAGQLLRVDAQYGHEKV